MAAVKEPPEFLRPALAPGRRLVDRVIRWESRASSYIMILGSSVLLLVLGLVMVLSSSSVSQALSGNSVFKEFQSQLTFALVGVVPMLIASRIPVPMWKKLAWPLMLVSIIALVLVFVPHIGFEAKGNRNWINLRIATFQPSEAAKFALCVWCAAVLAVKRPLVNFWSHALIPVGPAAVMVLGLILLGNDLGTAIVVWAIVFGMMFVAGFPLRMLGAIAAVSALGAFVMVVTSANRMVRIVALFSGSESTGSWQADHSRYALASGGFLGVGIGGSREKWNYLPEAHNDFIYAIIGEELGMPGTVGVLVLIGVIGAACIRIIYRHNDMFVKIATAGVFSWIVGQALINVSVVAGLLPVLGVPLPLVSSGGSSLVMTMTAVGMLLAFARSADEPVPDKSPSKPTTKKPVVPASAARKKLSLPRQKGTSS